jgi:hypothetical protein
MSQTAYVGRPDYDGAIEFAKDLGWDEKAVSEVVNVALAPMEKVVLVEQSRENPAYIKWILGGPDTDYQPRPPLQQRRLATRWRGV